MFSYFLLTISFWCFDAKNLDSRNYELGPINWWDEKKQLYGYLPLISQTIQVR